jgi:hypothetical protein
MQRELQVSQLQTLSRDVLWSCASRVGRANVSLSGKSYRTKQSLSEFIVHILRSSLQAVDANTTFLGSQKVLLRLRLTPIPSILQNHHEFLQYFQSLLESAVFTSLKISCLVLL